MMKTSCETIAADVELIGYPHLVSATGECGRLSRSDALSWKKLSFFRSPQPYKSQKQSVLREKNQSATVFPWLLLDSYSYPRHLQSPIY